jgi:hypothetical protein
LCSSDYSGLIFLMAAAIATVFHFLPVFSPFFAPGECQAATDTDFLWQISFVPLKT